MIASESTNESLLNAIKSNPNPMLLYLIQIYENPKTLKDIKAQLSIILSNLRKDNIISLKVHIIFL